MDAAVIDVDLDLRRCPQFHGVVIRSHQRHGDFIRIGIRGSVHGRDGLGDGVLNHSRVLPRRLANPGFGFAIGAVSGPQHRRRDGGPAGGERIKVVDQGRVRHGGDVQRSGETDTLVVLSKGVQFDTPEYVLLCFDPAYVGCLTACVGARSAEFLDLACVALDPDQGQRIDICRVLGKTEIGTDRHIGPFSGLAEGLRQALAGNAAGVEVQQADVMAACLPALLGVPAQHETLCAILRENHCRKLRILVQLAVGGSADVADHRAVGFIHHGIDDLPVRDGFVIPVRIQRIGNGSRAVGHHGGSNALDGTGGAIIERQGLSPCAVLVHSVQDGVLLVKIGDVVRIVRGYTAPGNDGPVSGGGHGGSYVRAVVLGQTRRCPCCAVVDRGTDLRAVHHHYLIIDSQSRTGVLVQADRLPRPGGHGEVLRAVDGKLAVAISVVIDSAAPGVAAAAQGGVGRTGIRHIRAVHIRQIDQHLAVTAQFGIGIGIGVAFQTADCFCNCRSPQETALCTFLSPYAASVLQILPALHRGREVERQVLLTAHAHHGGVTVVYHLINGADQVLLIGLPEAVDRIPIARGFVQHIERIGEQNLFITDEQEFYNKLQAHLAVNFKVLAVQVCTSVVLFTGGKKRGVAMAGFRQIGPVEPPELHIQGNLPEDAQLEGHHGKVEAHAGEQL